MNGECGDKRLLLGWNERGRIRAHREVVLLGGDSTGTTGYRMSPSES